MTLRLDHLRWGWPATADDTPPILGPATSLSTVLPAGSRLAVVGPSGIGKSTLLLTLAGLLEPRDGGVTASDTDGAPVPLRSAACYFAEEAHIFSTTLGENLRVARGDVTDDEMREALVTVGLGDWLAGLPKGLDTVLTGGAEAMSGGQRRRLLLARALVHRASIVLLDEPTEHLDADDSEQLLRHMLATDAGMFGRDRTVVVVTHQLPAEANGALDANVVDLTPLDALG